MQQWSPKARAILDAASELFYEQGIHAVGVDAIAAHGAVTKKTLYDRFGSKAQLVAAYLDERDHQWRDVLAPHLEAAGPDPETRLRAIFHASALWSAERGHRGCAMINAHAEISDPDHPARAVIARQKAWMRELFADIARDAGARDPESRADGLMVAHEGALAATGMGVVPNAFTVAHEMCLAMLSADPGAAPVEAASPRGRS